MSPLSVDIDLDQLVEKAKAFDLLESAVAILDGDGKPFYENAAFERFNRAVRDSNEGHNLHPSLLDCPAIAQVIQQVLVSAHTQSCAKEFFYNRRSSVVLTLLARPILQAGRKTVGGVMLTVAEESIEFNNRHMARLQAAVQSLSARVRSLSKERINSERLIRVLFKEAPFAMMLFNEQRQVVQVNKAGEKLFDMTASQLIGTPCANLIECNHWCDQPQVQKGIRKFDIGEVYGLRRDGSRIPLLRSAVMFPELEGALLLEAYVDLREREQAQEKFQQLSEYHELVLNSTDEGIFGVDPQLRCTFANPAAAKQLGYKPAELLGQDMYQLIQGSGEGGSSLARSDIPVFRSIRDDISLQEEDGIFLCKDGSSIPVQYRCNPLHDKDGVMGAVIVYRNVAEARSLALKMDYLATHDFLTGLLNRRVFEQRLDMAILVAQQDKVEHVLCFIDLDQFKIVNDTCGHNAGDEMLRQVTGLLQEQIRKTDLLARLGGDEFAVLLESCDKTKGLEVIEKLRGVISDYRFSWNQKIFTTSASLGMVMIDADIGSSAHAMSVADSACYAAKEKGRNRVHVYEVGDKELALRRGEIHQIEQIRIALEENQFALSYQPIVRVCAPTEIGRHVEILLRMRATNGDLIGPGVFIPAAERYNLMSSIDRWVVTETLQWLHRQKGALGQLEMCAINLSGQSVGDEQFLNFLLRQLDEHALPEGLLCFEITETAAIANLARASHFIRKIKERGHHFALDDFGAGMSSFHYLRNLPVDFLKIDGNFVKDMTHDRVDYAMVEAIHRVGQVMGIKTIAEFVENQDILACLREIGVDYAQGYGIAKPCLLEESLRHKSPPRKNT